MTRTIAPAIPIKPIPAVDAAHSLLVSAQKITETDDRWLGGLKWVPETEGLGWGIWDPLPLDDEGELVSGGPLTKADEGDGSSEQTYQPVVVNLLASCFAGVDGVVDVQAKATRQLESVTPLAMEQEFWDGTRAGNLSLRRSTPAQSAFTGGPFAHARLRSGILNPSYQDGSTLTAVSPAVALRLLSYGLARAEVPARGMIHAPTPLVEAWNESGLLDKDGPRLITKSRGDIVVAYSGGSWSGPLDLDTAGDADVDTLWAYATDAVQYRLGDPKPYEQTTSEALRRRTGRIGYRIERDLAVTTDTSSMYAVKVDVLT